MGRVESNLLVDPKVFKPLRDEMDLTIAKDKELSASLQKTLDLQVKIAKQSKRNAKGFKAIASAEKKSIGALNEKEKVDKRILSLEQKLTKVTQIRQKREAALTIELARRKKILKEQAILENKNISAFDRLNVKIKQQTERYKALIVQEGKETKRTRLLRKEIQKLTAVRFRATESVKTLNAATKRSTGLMGKLRGGLAQLGLAFAGFALVRNIVGTITDFDTAITNLGAVSGKTADEIAPLKQQALELGATTQNTASEIASLQLELAKLGFTVDEIMASTGGIQKFALATGAEIPDAAKLAGSAMRAFGLDASEMDRIVSVLAVATTKTALDFGFLQTAMSTIAPVANAFGFSIEDTTALLGQLANAGFDASSAATATRNILLNLADANGALAKELGRPIKSADDLAGALFELQEKGIDLASALELTDKRSVAAFETFLKGSDSLVELRDSITGVTGELDEMSEKKLDSIAGATDLLKSAWEGLILEWNEGAGFGEILKNVLKFLAQNLKEIISIVGKALTIFVSYKAALKAATLANKIFGGSLSKMKTSFGAIGIAVSSLVIIVGSLIDNYKNAARAGKALEEVTDRVNEALIEEKTELALVFKALKETTRGTKERESALDDINAKYGLTLQNLEDENAFVQQLAIAYAGLVQQLRKKIEIEVIGELLKEETKKLFKLQKVLEEAKEAFIVDPIAIGFIQSDIDITLEEINSLGKRLLEIQKPLEIPLGAKTSIKAAQDVSNEIIDINKEESKKVVDEKKEQLDKLLKLHELQALELENLLIDEGRSQEEITLEMMLQRKDFLVEQLQLIRKLYGDETILFQKTLLEFNKLSKESFEDIVKDIENVKGAIDDVVKAMESSTSIIDDLEKQEAELWKSIRKDIAETEALFEQFMQNNIKLIDKQIEAEQRNFDDSKTREQELKDLAKEKNLDAGESIAFEREQQKKALEEQRKLEEKKAKIEALIVALRLLAVKIEAGEGNPIASIKANINEVKSFIEGAFYEGTPYTIADALGYDGSKDSHTVNVDDGESIFNGKQTKDLDIGKGKNSTQDIVDFYKSGILAKSIRSSVDDSKINQPNIYVENNSKLINEVKKLVKNTAPDMKPKELMSFNAVVGAFEWQYKSGQKRKKISYPVRKR